jgi:hypothetical protein
VDDRKGFRERSMIPEFGTPLEIARAIYLEALQQFRARDSDGTATAAANGDLPVPQDCQARAEGIAPNPPETPERKVHDQQ